MTFKPATWYPIAVALSAANLVGAAFVLADPMHAGLHVTVGLAFGVWAQRLRQNRGRREAQAGFETTDALEAVDALEIEVSRMRRELSEAQERLDFVERLLARGAETRRVGVERQDPPK
jgi:hypothetical protein